MYVCICNGVTDQEIREVSAAGCRSVAELTMRTGCGASCGCCLETAAALLEELRVANDVAPSPALQMLTHAA